MGVQRIDSPPHGAQTASNTHFSALFGPFPPILATFRPHLPTSQALRASPRPRKHGRCSQKSPSARLQMPFRPPPVGVSRDSLRASPEPALPPTMLAKSPATALDRSRPRCTNYTHSSRSSQTADRPRRPDSAEDAPWKRGEEQPGVAPAALCSLPSGPPHIESSHHPLAPRHGRSPPTARSGGTL